MVSPYKDRPPSDERMWVCIYPVYINAKRTLAQGRRIPKEKAVDTPTSQEIVDILKNAGLNVKLEKKMHPLDQNRDSNFQGRVRIQLKNEDGTLCQPTFASRDSLLLYAAEMIPKLKSRLQKAPATVGEQTQGQQKAQKKAKRR